MSRRGAAILKNGPMVHLQLYSTNASYNTYYINAHYVSIDLMA
jgi:hypothetical protein